MWRPLENSTVVDNLNHRISSYNPSTGAFTGWIGRIGSAPSGGCSTVDNGSYNVSTGGWCTGGTSAESSGSGDKFGGFRFFIALAVHLYLHSVILVELLPMEQIYMFLIFTILELIKLV